MKKFISRKKTCYIKLNTTQTINQLDIKKMFNELLKKGFYHFYFSIEDLQSPMLKFLIRLKKIYKNINIFVVHANYTSFWPKEDINNLPIALKGNMDEKSEIRAWLMNYCDLVINNNLFVIAKENNFANVF